MFFTILSLGAISLFFLKMAKPNTFKKLMMELTYKNVGLGGIICDNIYRWKNVLKEIPNRKGDVAVITGGARGIGLHVVKGLVRAQMTVVMGVRNVDAAKLVCEQIKREYRNADLRLYKLDLTSMKSVEEFCSKVANDFPEINLLVNNAGVLKQDYEVTEDGFESQMGTNYISHFYLTHLLLENLNAGGQKSNLCSRIVNVASCMHIGFDIDMKDINMEKFFHYYAGYARSKLAQIMFTHCLGRRLKFSDSPVKTYAVHPGLVATDMFYKTSSYVPLLYLVMKTPEQGAIPILHTCFSSTLEEKDIVYISNCVEGFQSPFALNPMKQETLFRNTCDMLKIKKYGAINEVKPDELF